MATEIQVTSQAFLLIGGSTVFLLEKPTTKIGRSFDNDLIFKYPQISRKHAEIRQNKRGFEIVDMNSTGGTYVNGIKIWRYDLNSGDVISLVNLHLVFEMGPVPDSTTEYQPPKDRTIAIKETKTLPSSKLKSENKEKISI